MNIIPPEPEQEPNIEVVRELEHAQPPVLAMQLEQPEFFSEEQLDIVAQLRETLHAVREHPPPQKDMDW